MSNGQRAIWTFLLITLAGPLLGAMALAASATVWSIATGTAPALALSTAGKIAIHTFVVGSFVAAIAAAGLAAIVALRGTISWLEAAVAGVAAFMVVAISTGAVASTVLSAIAFLAACVAIVCRLVLVRIKILPGP